MNETMPTWRVEIWKDPTFIRNIECDHNNIKKIIRILNELEDRLEKIDNIKRLRPEYKDNGLPIA